MAGALDGIRILDLSWGIAGPLGVLLLAEQGADVIKVEPPGGDPYRGHPGSAVWHRSRRSVELDLKNDAARADFLRLVDTADVVVEAFSPGTMDRLGLGYDVLSARSPRLVYCSIPAYPPGHRAARRAGYDALVQARSGQQCEQPGWRPGPIHLHFQAPSMGACFLAATGIVAALIDRERTGRGQHVATSLYQGVLAYTTQIWQEHERPGPGFRSIMPKSYPPGVHQSSVYECADGEWIHAATMSGGTPTRTVEDILGVDNPADLRAAFLRRARDELVEQFHAAGLGAEPIVAMEAAYEHGQIVANQMVARVADPELGMTTQIGVPMQLSRTPGAIQGPRPTPGQHTEEVLAELARPRNGTGLAATAQRSSGRDQFEAVGPLAGFTVLDIGQFLAGPFAPMILSDLGATVIKVEPLRGDFMRLAAMPFIGCQRGKLGVAVDLKSPEGVEVLLRLAEQADVVHHNMTKGTAQRLGIHYETLRARNPALVHCNTYAYGPEGPMSDFGGLDPLYQAACGLEHEAGAVAEGNPPLYLRFGMTDTANAFVSVVGVLAALFDRERSGLGQDVWTSLLNGAAVFGSDVFLRDDAPAPRRPGLDRGQHGTSPCYRLYATQDGWVQIAACSTEQWRALCGVLALPELVADERCVSYEARVAHRSEIEPLIESAFAIRTAVTWVHLLDAASVPAEVAVDTADGESALHDGDNERLGLVTESAHPLLGRIRQFGTLINFSAGSPSTFRGPPMVGEHTRQVLADRGFSAEDIAGLFERGVVAEPTDDYAWQL
ncbi:MAG TPA: CoA transferase [Acidimicrobiales bacterium]|nr:CoA transferase [Acidimicrobiales bacterium]